MMSLRSGLCEARWRDNGNVERVRRAKLAPFAPPDWLLVRPAIAIECAYDLRSVAGSHTRTSVRVACTARINLPNFPLGC